MTHRLLSCYYCGGELRYPTKLVTEPLRSELVSVCGPRCASQLWKLNRKLERNAAALTAARTGRTVVRGRDAT